MSTWFLIGVFGAPVVAIIATCCWGFARDRRKRAEIQAWNRRWQRDEDAALLAQIVRRRQLGVDQDRALDAEPPAIP